MKLIVGLGNPGNEYINTRHNIGFSLIDKIADNREVKLEKVKFNGLYGSYNIDNEKIILLKPLSYMNLSGEVVKKFVDFFKINLNDVLVIQDDLDMNFGRIKLVFNSSCGGHNGIRDIERYFGTKSYARLKIGISNNKNIDTKDYVLGKFNNDEIKILNDVYDKLILIDEDFCNLSLDRIMSKYNNK